MDADDFNTALEEYHRAARDFVKGNPEPYKAVFSHRDDVSLGNPFGPFVTGWSQVAATMERASSLYRDGEVTEFQTLAKSVTADLAYVVEVERIRAKIAGGKDVVSVVLRATSIMRPEDGAWRIVHRHADPITASRPAESIIER